MDNLANITARAWILALIIRSDGERLLLGDGWFDFKQSLQHFQPNTFVNDIVELQGTDGQLLAGQVRRTAKQNFDGYIGDATVAKVTIEERRRQFLQFFRKRMFYKVVYIFPDGTAIQRRRGYIVDAPSVPEMWQKWPEYHVALNFEDVNYYEYAEDAEGDEIYSNIVEIEPRGLAEGGLIWDNLGAVSLGYRWLNPQTVTGDYITISDAIEDAPLTLTQLSGNAEQTTYSGKNLIEVADVSLTDQTINYYRNQSPTINTTLVAGQSYTFSCDMTIGGSVTNCVVSMGCGTTTYGHDIKITSGVTSGHFSVTFTPTENDLTYGDSFYFRLPYIAGTTTGVNFSFSNVQLELGSTATAYEPYVGGTASPNPDYPQDIQVVTGENTVGITGKNLLNAQQVVADSNNAETYITSDGDWVRFKTGGIQMIIKNSTHAQGSLTLTAIIKSGVATSNSFGLSANYTDGTQEVISALTTTDTDEHTFTWTSNSSKTLDYLNTRNTWGKEMFLKIAGSQLELGSTATTYEPYQGQSYEVNLGKNLFDKDNANTIHYYAANSGFSSNTNATSIYIPIIGGQTYTVSSTDRSLIQSDASLVFTDALVDSTSTAHHGKNAWSLNASSITATAPSDAKYMYVYVKWGTNATTIANALATLQVELGSQPTTFAPYFTPLELAKIGTYQDKIIKTDGTWYIHKEVGKVVFAGVGGENWQRAGLTSGARFYSLQNDLGLPNRNNLDDEMMSNNFTEVMYATYYQAGGIDGIAFSYYNSNHYIQVFSTDTSLTSASAFAIWLQSHPTTVYYALATPTDTEITNSALLEQLGTISDLYGGVNNISLVPSAGAQGEMTVQYYTELDTSDAGYEWEAGGSTGTTVVTVAGIDNASPIWKVTGPATDPTLTNITTGQALTWNGTVPAGQTLTIDMGEQTADLAGANVFALVSGSWIELQAGTNTLVYTASGATEPSILSWNGVVG